MFIDAELFREYYRQFARNYSRQLRLSLDTGELRDDIDIETLSFTLMGIANFVGLQAILLSDDDVCLSDVKIEELAQNAMKLIDKGMLKWKDT